MIVSAIEVVDDFIITFLCSLDLGRVDQNDGEALAALENE